MTPKTVSIAYGRGPFSASAADTQGVMAGSIVLTLDGEMAVDDITIGTRMITRDCGMAWVTVVRSRRVYCDVVRILAGSLGHTRPERDVMVPADQRILVRDWRAKAVFSHSTALVAARALVDGEFVTLLRDQQITIYQIEFDVPHILYADGLEMTSFAPACAIAEAA